MLLTQLLDIESIAHNASPDADLAQQIQTDGFSSLVPVVRIIEGPSVHNDFESVYECVQNPEIVASWPFNRISVFVIE